MEKNIKALERKLNKIIDDELKKDVSQMDCDLIVECSDALLRLEDAKRYAISESEMRKSIDSVIGKKSKIVTKLTKPMKILLIAAIILILLAIGSLGYAQYKNNIFDFSDHSTVSFAQSDNQSVGDFNLGFVPEGFTLSFERDNKYERSKEYASGNEVFSVTKQSSNNKAVNINTEYKTCKITKINGIDYIEYGEAKHGRGIVWEKNGYQYMISGNFSAEELLKIAASVS